MVVDTLAQSYRFPDFKVKFHSLVSEGMIGPHKVMLCKPATFMNRSGQALGPLMHFYKLPLDNLYVVHDDLDLSFGRIKIKQGGGSGGHKGLGSLDQAIGQDYWRLRVGIGHPGHADAVSAYVLGNFNGHEQKELIPLLTSIAEWSPELFGCNPAVWLNQVSQRLKP